MKKSPVSDVIVTKRLPTMCPACGFVDRFTVSTHVASSDSTHRGRVDCFCGCSWSAKYELQDADV